MRIFEIVHKRVSVNFLDLILFYAFSIAVFCFLLYTIFAWFEVYERRLPFRLLGDVNPKITLIKMSYEDGLIRGKVEGKAARFIWNDKIILPNEQGDFELLF